MAVSNRNTSALHLLPCPTPGGGDGEAALTPQESLPSPTSEEHPGSPAWGLSQRESFTCPCFHLVSYCLRTELNRRRQRAGWWEED